MVTKVGTNGNNLLTGTANADILRGLAGNDTLVGLGGLDRLFGGIGNDILEGGAGRDRMFGDIGDDWVSYRTAPSGVIINLLLGEGSLGHADDDVYFSIENGRGSRFADTLFGTHGNNILEGLGQLDNLSGYGGDDLLRGGPGGDILFGGTGNDVIDPGNDNAIDGLNGQDGIDTVDYSKMGGAVIVDLRLQTSGGAADADSYAGVESVIGSRFADTLTPANDGTAFGGGGNDFLYGGGNGLPTTLVGGPGADTLTGRSSEQDLFRLQYRKGADTVVNMNTGEVDRFVIGKAEFGVGSALDPDQVRVLTNGNPVADINAGQFIFIDAGDLLYFDRDGTNTVFAPVLVAVVTGFSSLGAGDFIVA